MDTPNANSAMGHSPNSEKFGMAFSHNRQFERARTFLTGVLMADGYAVDVLIRDFSKNGARLRVKGKVPNATTFSIRVNGVGQFQARMRWRDGNMLGFQFINEPDYIVRNLDGRLKEILYKKEEITVPDDVCVVVRHRGDPDNIADATESDRR